MARDVDDQGGVGIADPGEVRTRVLHRDEDPRQGRRIRGGTCGYRARTVLLHSVHDQPGTASVHVQFHRVLDALTDKLPRVAEHLEAPGPTCWPSPPNP